MILRIIVIYLDFYTNIRFATYFMFVILNANKFFKFLLCDFIQW